jgi:hypothetical protein
MVEPWSHRGCRDLRKAHNAMANEPIKRSNTFEYTVWSIASVVVALLLAHYVFGFFPTKEGYY